MTWVMSPSSCLCLYRLIAEPKPFCSTIDTCTMHLPVVHICITWGPDPRRALLQKTIEVKEGELSACVYVRVHMCVYEHVCVC